MFERRYIFHRHVTIRHEEGEVVIEIGPRRESVFYFHAVFGAAFAGFTAYQLLPAIPRGWRMGGWLRALGGAGFAGVFVLVSLFLALNGIHQLTSTETLRVDRLDRTLSIITTLLTFQQVRTFPLDEVRDLRLRESKLFANPSALAFNSRKWRYEFATGASEDERKQILRALAEALPAACVEHNPVHKS